ncbi:hypothetical protein U1Q18_000615 [Sarracenia purpurea var. burkii]
MKKKKKRPPPLPLRFASPNPFSSVRLCNQTRPSSLPPITGDQKLLPSEIGGENEEDAWVWSQIKAEARRDLPLLDDHLPPFAGSLHLLSPRQQALLLHPTFHPLLRPFPHHPSTSALRRLWFAGHTSPTAPVPSSLRTDQHRRR